MKIVKTFLSIFLFMSTISSIQHTKLSDKGFYPGSTEMQLLSTSTPLINMSDSTSQILNSCLKIAFTDKYEHMERDLWAKLEKVNSKPNEMYKRAFWSDFFGNVKEEFKDTRGVAHVCGVILTVNLKKDSDFNDANLQKKIRDSMGDYTKKVASLVSDRSKVFITSSISTHRYSSLVDKNVFNSLNQRANLK